MSEPSTDFGFERVAEAAKAKRVSSVFSSVARRYDIMNDLMSGGLHRSWKAFAIQMAGVRLGQRVLDVAAGTGDLTIAHARRAGETGEVWHTDINPDMLREGRDRLTNAGLLLPSLLCDAEKLPFPDNHFDCVTVAFGLRNMTHKDRALAEFRRVLKPGGRALVLEFSRVAKPLEKMYDLYSFKVLPWLGRQVAKDEASYRYLAESIRMHPPQAELKAMMKAAGFGHVDVHNLSAGIVALHVGIKC